MVLETIYVVRHGYRSNWVVDPTTGEYTATVRSPTNIASDPALASYGVQQAEQLSTQLLSVDPPVDLVYSSPFYRCLQTLLPTTNGLVERQKQSGKGKAQVNVEPGLGEFYGLARFDHPSPASMQVLHTHFQHLASEPEPIIVPSTKGESNPQLHDRLAYTLHHLIARADADPSGPKSLLICTHAAAMICIGRALTGYMPDDEKTADFNCFTCAFSRFDRRKRVATGPGDVPQTWNCNDSDHVPDIGWRDGKGVQGGWDCVVNGDCSFLTNGPERGWRFSGDESFIHVPLPSDDKKDAAVAVTDDETRLDDAVLVHGDGGKARKGSASRL